MYSNENYLPLDGTLWQHPYFSCPSKIIVYVRHNKDFYVIDEFNGYFTDFKCYEDSLQDIIRKANNNYENYKNYRSKRN